jgi:tetraacyldisaccharide 4'-kinase
VYNEKVKKQVVEIHSVTSADCRNCKTRTVFCQFKDIDDVCLSFPDHHNFTEKDILEIKNLKENYYNYRKDYVRLKGRLPRATFHLPKVTSSSEDFDAKKQKKFNKTIIEYGNKYKKPLTRLRRKSILHQNTV